MMYLGEKGKKDKKRQKKENKKKKEGKSENRVGARGHIRKESGRRECRDKLRRLSP